MRPDFQKSLILLLVVSIVSACATTNKEPTPEESLLAAVGRLSEAVAAKNPDAVMELLSPTFYHPEIGHREDAYTMMNLTLESGYSGGFVLDYSAVEYDIDKETGRAHLYPLTLKGDKREFRIGLDMVMQPDDGEWLLVTFQLE